MPHQLNSGRDKREPGGTAASATAGDDLVDAKAAAQRLSVKPQTLYAYVSRGLIRTRAQDGTKARLYYLEDLDRIRSKGPRQSKLAASTERSLGFAGRPVTQTTITSITSQGPAYRGLLATDLVQQRKGFEACVELLWSGVLPGRSITWKPPQTPPELKPFMNALSQVAPHNSSRRLMAMTVEAYSVCIGRNPESAHGAPVLAARHLIQALPAVFGLLKQAPRFNARVTEEPVAAAVARHGGLAADPDVRACIDACLILCADHELAPSTFAARIAASAGADLFACVNSALGAFEGQLTGMGCDDAENAIRASRSVKSYLDAVRIKRDRHEPVSGYGHPLYADGDPRAAKLLAMARDVADRTPASRIVFNCIDAVEAETGLAPNLAIGLVAMCVALGLPHQSPGGLMALGRCAGWIAHVFEQRLAGYLLRPRAHYIGPAVR